MNAQDSTSYVWSEPVSYTIDSTDTWMVDNLSNLYICESEMIKKFDSVGLLQFNQSIKSFGHTSSLVHINAMKTVHFSEEQQTICFLDNTLTQLDDCIELIDRNIVNAHTVAASSRAEMIWVYDNVNSTLQLINFDGSSVQQEQSIINLKGTLGIEEVDQIVEKGNTLYLLDRSKGIYILDMYGTLLEFIPATALIQLEGNLKADHIIYYITDSDFVVRILQPSEEAHEMTFSLPVRGVREFRVVNEVLYLRTAKNVHKFRLELDK
jgi:hypothetical protein